MKYNIIAIEREYASGGSEIGERTGKILGIPCYGREVLERAAQKLNTVPERLLHLEETTSNSFLFSLGMATRVAIGERDGLSEEGALYVTEERVIREMALQGPCVIVGRCAGWILRERSDVLRVFIRADRSFRKERAQTEYGIPEKQVENVLKRFDRRRSNFYSANTCMRWDDSRGYDLVLDSSSLGIETCAAIISRTARGGKESAEAEL